MIGAASAEFLQECVPITFYCRLGVAFGESKVESLAAVRAGSSSRPRAEAVNQPRNRREICRAQDVQGWLFTSSGHTTILTNVGLTLVPVGGLLEGVGETQHILLAPMRTDDLQSNRQPGACAPAGDRNRR